MSGPRYAREVTVVGDSLRVVLECWHVAWMPIESAPRGWRIAGDAIDLRRALRGSLSCTEPGCEIGQTAPSGEGASEGSDA